MKSTQPIEVIITVPAGVDMSEVFTSMQQMEEEAFAGGALLYDHTENLSVATGIIQQIKERIVT